MFGFSFRVEPFPLEEAIGKYQASLVERRFEGWLLIKCFEPGVKGALSDVGVFCPWWNEALLTLIRR